MNAALLKTKLISTNYCTQRGSYKILLLHFPQINDELCKSFGIRRSITSEYHLQTNGLIEQIKKTEDQACQVQQ